MNTRIDNILLKQFYLKINKSVNIQELFNEIFIEIKERFNAEDIELIVKYFNRKTDKYQTFNFNNNKISINFVDSIPDNIIDTFNSNDIIKNKENGIFKIQCPIKFNERTYAILIIYSKTETGNYSLDLLKRYLPQFSFYLRFILSFEYINFQYKTIKKKYNKLKLLEDKTKINKIDYRKAVNISMNSIKLELLSIIDKEFIGRIEYIKSQIFSIKKYFSRILYLFDSLIEEENEEIILSRIRIFKEDKEIIKFYRNIDGYISETSDEILMLQKYIKVINIIEKRDKIKKYSDIHTVLSLLFNSEERIKIIAPKKDRKVKKGYFLLIINYLILKYMLSESSMENIIKFEYIDRTVVIDAIEKNVLKRFYEIINKDKEDIVNYIKYIKEISIKKNFSYELNQKSEFPSLTIAF